MEMTAHQYSAELTLAMGRAEIDRGGNLIDLSIMLQS